MRDYILIYIIRYTYMQSAASVCPEAHTRVASSLYNHAQSLASCTLYYIMTMQRAIICNDIQLADNHAQSFASCISSQWMVSLSIGISCSLPQLPPARRPVRRCRFLRVSSFVDVTVMPFSCVIMAPPLENGFGSNVCTCRYDKIP